MRVAGRGPDPDAPLLAIERRAALLPVYTAATVAAGLAALVVVTLLATLPAAIAVPGVGAPWAGVAGIALWTVFGLAGSIRVVRGPSGHGVLTFHLPFIVAAMVLGGPIAGGWVAFIASFERRELREMPWYGALANHAGLALAAILGGLTAHATVATAQRLGLPGGLGLTLVGAAVGTLVLAVVQTGLAAGVIVLRDGLTLRETLHVFDRSFRGTLIAETVLGWVFVVTWVAVGWWAPVLCAALVLALWRTNAAEAERDRDELTGLLTARAFAVRVAEAALRGRRGIEGSAYVFLDLDGFKQVNDGPRSHAVGDEVLAQLGERLRRAIRVTDAAGRRGGDEFMVLFVGVRDEATGVSLAERVHTLVTTPYQTSDGEKVVGASVGVALVVPGERDFEPDLRRRADSAMYVAKGGGGGVRAWQEPPPDQKPEPEPAA
ncbi:MAG TPA: GGDEF domain-containing protein [Candidatus Limnocylindrales bacterium]|nr:GGDEF domain-containing protein [Candidatus Limnocylindrales bacterium]